MYWEKWGEFIRRCRTIFAAILLHFTLLRKENEKSNAERENVELGEA